SITGLGITGGGLSEGNGPEFLCKPYHNVSGIDPHNFFLSVWRDEGAIFTLLWVLAWFYYWNLLISLKPQLGDTRMRLVLGMLAISVVQFCLAPPSTGMRLLVALIMGSALGFANKRSLVNIDHLHKQDYSSDQGRSLIQGHIRSKSEDSATFRGIHVVHVTEALTAGVLYYLHQLIKAQVEAGLDVTLVHSFRRDTPAPEILDQLFPSPISRVVIPMTTNISMKADFKSFKEIAKLLKSLHPDVIHLHSSKAGALGRAAAWQVGLNISLYYSPHGFSFLRQDVSLLKRALYFVLEVIGGFFGGKIIAVSASEGRLANRLVSHHRVCVVENCTDVPEFTWPKRVSETRLRIISAGRLSYQKAPWRFWKLSASLFSENSDFIWIGDGELRKQLEGAVAHTTVRVTGWIDRNDLWREMYAADVFVMTSLWEGMPLTLIEAQAIGLPAIVPDVVGCRDVVIDGVTGFICKNDGELIEKTRLLVRDAELRVRMGQAARSMAMVRFSIKRMHGEILNAYGLPHRILS
ncbi:MAG TPA: glycosyltransferase, partial [Methylococcales bacterium]